MGVDLEIMINKKQASKLLKEITWDDFLYLLKYEPYRWYRFLEEFDVNEDWVSAINGGILRSFDMIKLVATSEMDNDEKERFIDILLKYDLIFLPDIKVNDELRKNYVSVFDLFYAIQKLVNNNTDAVIKMAEEGDVW